MRKKDKQGLITGCAGLIESAIREHNRNDYERLEQIRRHLGFGKSWLGQSYTIEPCSTLAEKVMAMADYLGIGFEVQNEKQTTTPRSVKVVKKPKVKK